MRERHWGWEIRWLLESPPQTSHQHKTASAHLSVPERAFQLAEQRYLFINRISRECRHRRRLQSRGAAPQTIEMVVLGMHAGSTRAYGLLLVVNYRLQSQSMSRVKERNHMSMKTKEEVLVL